MAERIPLQRDPPVAAPTDLVEWLAIERRMAAAAASVRRALTAAGNDRFGETEQLVLWHCFLGPEEGMGQSDLVAELGCSPAQVSGTVESLRRQGQLRSQRCPRDRRRQRWSLTTAGRSTVESWREPMATALAELNARMPATALAGLGSLLARFLESPAAEIQATPEVPPTCEPGFRQEAA